MPPLLNHLPSTAKMDVAFAFTSQKRVVKDFLLVPSYKNIVIPLDQTVWCYVLPLAKKNYGLYINSDAAAELGITIPDDIAQEAQECAE